MRYAALRDAAVEAGIDTVLLAHHQDDQAETLLLQLARGAGPHGLASMPVARRDGPIVWLRPMLGVTRAAIEAYARARAFEWVDDESNVNTRFRRNAWRHRIIPLIASVASGYPATVARAAEHQADAAHLLDELALLDAGTGYDGSSLTRSALQALSRSRAGNLLRWFLRQHGLPPPSAPRLAAMLDQLVHARADARVRIVHAGAEVGVHRERIMIHAAPPPPFELGWKGEPSLVLPHGTLSCVATRGAGIDAARLRSGTVVIRSRRGGERLRLASDRPRRRLKSLLQDAGVAPWERASLPLVYCGEKLVAVAGLGVDDAFRAPPYADGFELLWRPA